MGTEIPAATLARLAALDGVCDFRMDRRERTPGENAGRAFRFWRVEVVPRGHLDRPQFERTFPLAPAPEAPHIYVEAPRLADALARAVELAGSVTWPEPIKAPATTG